MPELGQSGKVRNEHNMSGLPPITDLRADALEGPLSATTRLMHCNKTASLFDHLVGDREQLRGHRKTKCLRSLDIDHQLEIRELHDG
jgi:hypothetical protein